MVDSLKIDWKKATPSGRFHLAETLPLDTLLWQIGADKVIAACLATADRCTGGCIKYDPLVKARDVAQAAGLYDKAKELDAKARLYSPPEDLSEL